jgi:hypothetical protein
MKLSELVEKYIELRDKKSQLKAEYDAQKSKIDEKLDKIEAVLLQTFDTAGLNSIKTPFGTAYTSTTTMASIADPDTFMEFVKANEAFHLLEKHCSKTGVEQYKAVHDDVPPGVNWREERVVNIRRAS